MQIIIVFQKIKILVFLIDIEDFRLRKGLSKLFKKNGLSNSPLPGNDLDKRFSDIVLNF
jgi:hypothetical protein